MTKYHIDSLLNISEVGNIINIFAKHDIELRLVGGCIRNTILQREIKDIDFAANKEPDIVINVLKKSDIHYKDFAKNFGSIIVFLNDRKFEITSLRKDINQKGRNTEVIYTKDWHEDATRRDFTMNALYLTQQGEIIDYFDGLEDLENNRIKFIGQIEKRITEDFLRIFRYYRFLGLFEYPKILDGYEKILNENFLKTFDYVPKELIRSEILKMLKNPFPLNSFANPSSLKKKTYWLEMTRQHFLEINYKLGLNKCLNLVEKLF